MADTLSGSGAAVTDSITPTDPGLTDAERARLSPQCARMLALLLVCPRWNYELADISLSYTRRLSDIRAHGYDITVIATGDTGARLYGLHVFKHLSDGSMALAAICDEEYQESMALVATESYLIDLRTAASDGWRGIPGAFAEVAGILGALAANLRLA